MLRGLLAWVTWDWSAMEDGFRRAEALYAARGDGDRQAFATAYRATNLISLGRVAEAGALLEGLARQPLRRDARIGWLNAQIWFSIESGATARVAALEEEMIALLEAEGELALWYHTSPPIRLPGMPGVCRSLSRHAEAMLRVAGDEPTVLRALALLAQGWCAAWRGDIEGSLLLQQRAREEAAWSGDSGAIRHHGYTLHAITCAMSGDREGAMAAASARRAMLLEAQGAWTGYILDQFVARVAATLEDALLLRSCLAALDAWEPALRAAGTPPDARRRHAFAAQLAWLEGRVPEAVAEWRAALAHEEAIDVYGVAVEVRIRLARALARGGDLAAAAEVLAPALHRVEAEQSPGIVLLAFEAALELARQPWAATLSPAHRTLLSGWPRLAPLRGQSREAAAPSGPESLTARELEVLERIAAGDSNKVIARSLDLSLHTVKRHVANILAKLGAATRGQAAAWLRGQSQVRGQSHDEGQPRDRQRA
jgi:LuxR family maltose regulon positive regulatory protein